MRLVPTLVAALCAVALLPLTAKAGDCDRSCGSGVTYRGSYHGQRLRYAQARAAQHARRAGTYRTHRCRPHAHGGSWADLRRLLPADAGALREMHVRSYFLRRFPFAAVDGDEDANSIAMLLAIGDEEQGSERALDAAGHLDRGTARVHVADYAGAKADFEASLAAKADEPRALWGLVLVALCTGQTHAAADRLDALAKQGEVKRGDRISETDTFADASKWKPIVEGLRASAQYRVSDGRTFAVTAWALYVSGREAEAKRYVRLAKRWNGPETLVRTLQTNVAPETALAAPAPEAPRRAPREAASTKVAQR